MPIDLSTAVNAKDDSAKRSSVINDRCCFICNTKIYEVFVKMSETVTSHSNTPVDNYVNIFLNGERSIRHQSSEEEEANSNRNLLCPECFNKINDYDLARVTAARLHQELKWELSRTEAIYASQQNVQNEKTNEPELIIGNKIFSKNH